MSKKGRPAGPAKILFRKRLTPAELQAVQTVLAGSLQPAVLPLAFTPGPSDAERHALPLPPSVSAGLGSLTQPAPILTPAEMAEHARAAQDAFDEELAARTQEERAKQLTCNHNFRENFAGEMQCIKCLVKAVPGQLNESLPPLPVNALGQKISPAAADVTDALQRSNEQLRLQTQRADDLQTQVEELQHACDKKDVEIERILQMGGTERQSKYIAQLQAKIVALGGNKGEFDQT